MRALADAVWPEVARGGTLVVPVGSLEQHGPHLPLDTDAVIASAVAARVGAELGALVAPVVAYGSSGEHQAFAGTLSIGTDALKVLLVELVRSASSWAARTLFVNGHGGNAVAVGAACGQLRHEGHDVAWAPCEWATHTPDGQPWDAHAGRSETSLMLHLQPEAVLLDRVEAGNTAPVADLLPAMIAGGVAAVSPNGVLGDPAGATAIEGARLLDAMVAATTARLAVLAP